jgi:signal transduction histidine kinase
MIPDAGHIELLRAAPWWTQERLRIALGGLCGVAGFAGVLAFAVGRKNRVLKLEIARREAAESRLFSERARMASDLHDNLQQTLLAASLQLNAAARTVEDNPAGAAGRVAMARSSALSAASRYFARLTCEMSSASLFLSNPRAEPSAGRLVCTSQ